MQWDKSIDLGSIDVECRNLNSDELEKTKLFLIDQGFHFINDNRNGFEVRFTGNRDALAERLKSLTKHGFKWR